MTTSHRDLLWWVRLYRLAFGLLIVVAVIYQLTRSTGSTANFFSFFTIQSNIIGAVVLLLGAAGFAPRTRQWDYLRGGAMIFLMLTGVIYNTLLTGISAELQTTVPWVNDVLHKIIPVVMVADVLIVPLAHKIEFRKALWWTAYPVAYAAYSLIRGPIVDWYPYPFLDPRESGYGRVTFNMISHRHRVRRRHLAGGEGQRLAPVPPIPAPGLPRPPTILIEPIHTWRHRPCVDISY